jgi:hypothetical protein
MNIYKRIYAWVKDYYAYDKSYITQMIAEEEKTHAMSELIDRSDRIIARNPNFIDQVKKSDTGCWMEQVYGTHKCNICDFTEDCPAKIKFEQEEMRIEMAVITQQLAELKKYAANQRPGENQGTLPQP